ncbi:MAG: hypothetical protein GF364_02045 [Candidatus Lokiarchaeota archaeon]|nr:hypothetical protein [Candidatus Lokiarchaeota archaeon]
MGFGKSLGIGLVIFIVLNFVMNLLLVLAGGVTIMGVPIEIGDWFGSIGDAPFGFLANLFCFQGGLDLGIIDSSLTGLTIGGLLPPSISLLLGLAGGAMMFSTDVFIAIVSILGVLLPLLITAIVCGKLADSPGQGYGSFLLVNLISAAILVVFFIIDYTQLGGHVAIFSLIAMMDPSMVMIAYIGIPVFGLFNGMFWGGISAVLGKEI